MFTGLKRTWDLDAIFPGQSSSPSFKQFLDGIETDLAALKDQLKPGEDLNALKAAVLKSQDTGVKLREAASFVSCLSSQNVNDKEAKILGARVKQLYAEYSAILTVLDKWFKSLSEDLWNTFLGDPELKGLTFNLNERRLKAREMLSSEQEALAAALAVDGYHGWSDLYDLVTGSMVIEVEENGKTLRLSPGQVQNRLSHPDPSVRANLMSRWEDAWSKVADGCALALNHLAGFRLNLYRARGWDSVLKEPLDMNRMTQKTLDAMWQGVESGKDRLVTYLKRKKKVLGLQSFGWPDIDAPVGKSESSMTYDQAADFIVEQFGRFSPHMAEFATKAFLERWIESEDRPGKRMGGFCTSFPVSGVSRIFVTFSGTLGNVSTVAHELGHGFHQSVMKNVPPMAQQYAMNVAETASTFAEMVVADAALKYARNQDEKLLLLDDKLSRAVALLMNIQSRFLFETRFYDERRKGFVPVERLNELMLQAQKDAYREALDLYHPHFWASKLHFYNTRVPFYNFPYTFGYLFSAGVYAKALESGKSFEEKYEALLQDTGRMTVEDLARTHLGVDLQTPKFWEEAVDLVLGDLEEFLKVTE